LAITLHVINKKKSIIDKIRRPSGFAQIAKTERKGLSKNIDSWFAKNNLGFDPKEFFVLILIILTIPILIGLLMNLHPIICLVFSIVTVFLFFIFIRIKNSREKFKKEEQMEQFLIDLTANLYSNPNVIKSINCVLAGLEDPLKKELETVVDENRRGILLDDCLKNMINRNNSELIEVIILGFIAANKKGVDLIKFLKIQIEYIRDKKSLTNYIKILSSGPRYTSYLIMLIPIISVIIISLINENFIRFMLSGMGLAVIAYAILSYGLGFLLINRIVNLNERGRTWD